MRALTLTHPVEVAGTPVAVPAGSVLTPEYVDSLVASCKDCSFPSGPLLAQARVRQDLVEFVTEPPYDNIFSGREVIDEALTAMADVRVAEPVLDALDYFRESDSRTYRQLLTVFTTSTLIAGDMGYRTRSQETLAKMGPTHDLGKLAIPLEILAKTTPLTRQEKIIVQNHSAAGYVLMSCYLGDPGALAARVARDHHERRNGSGRPRGITLQSLGAEIVAVCDVYDALISPRPYRPVSFDNRTALEVITLMAEGGEVGWDVVKALVARNRKSRPHYTESVVSKDKRGTPPEGDLYGVVEGEPEEAESGPPG